MRHIIVLPYWCEKEVAHFMQVLGRWDQFCQTDVEYSFLVARRFDAPEAPEVLEVCGRHAPTESLVCDRYRWKGWPQGANGMFRHVMEHVGETAPQDGGFFYWFEHDIIPIYADWLTWLHKTWKPEASMAGHYTSAPWINMHNLQLSPHISGSACFNKALARSPAAGLIGTETPFEFTLFEELQKCGGKLMLLPLLYDMWFLMPDWVKRCDLNRLMINGIKEAGQREVIIQYILKNRDS